MKGVGAAIYHDVIRALQNAEEMGGPDIFAYEDLMTAIVNECNRRMLAYRQSGWHPTVQFRCNACGLLCRADRGQLSLSRENGTDLTEQEIAEGWDYCLHCATGEHTRGEYLVETPPYVTPHGGECRLPACCIADIEGDALGLPR
jgi:hypothetical protein